MANTELANRARMALALADVLASWSVTAEVVSAMSDKAWELAACLIPYVVEDGPTPGKGYTPSPATRSAALAVLRDRERTADNPLTGFPQ